MSDDDEFDSSNNCSDEINDQTLDDLYYIHTKQTVSAS